LPETLELSEVTLKRASLFKAYYVFVNLYGPCGLDINGDGLTVQWDDLALPLTVEDLRRILEICEKLKG